MIARWMLAAALFAVLAGVAGLAAERALHAMQRQQRFPWIVALVVALGWPLLAPLVAMLAPAAAVEVAPMTVSVAEPFNVAARVVAGWADGLDGVLVALWIALSAALLVQVVVALRALRVARQLARPTIVDGESVLVAESLGPAVVGILTPRIVVPEWLLQLDAPLRALVIRHEREHVRSRDTGLVWLAVVATVLMPWNPGVWWISRRLRLAMEIDCDMRTLRDGAGHVGYAKLLLLIAQRQSTVRFLPMLAESSSHLGRRISAMRSRPLQQSAPRAAALAAVACVAAALACSPRIAGNLTGPAPAAVPASASSGDAVTMEAAPATASKNDGSAPKQPREPYFDFQVTKTATMLAGSSGPVYPPALRAARVEGKVLVQVVVDENGRLDMSTFKVVRSDHPDFAEAVKTALPAMRFSPAEVSGKPVRQLLQQPFMFALQR